VDVDDGTIPHESGLVPASVDFTKGCFLGQELVARIDSRGGNTPRHLRQLVIDGQVSAGETVTFAGDEVGTVTSAAGDVGLAMLKRSVSAGDEVEVAGKTAVVRELPAKTRG
jgi:folate-binding protein YgfZ